MIRQGGRNPRTLHWQAGPEPSDTDRFVGVMFSAELAAMAVVAFARTFPDMRRPDWPPADEIHAEVRSFLGDGPGGAP